MIKVLFDHQKFSTQKYGGISRYFANLINSIQTLSDFSYKLGVLHSENHYINHNIAAINHINRLIKKPNLVYKLNQVYSTQLIEKNDFDIFHPTYYDPYFIKKLKKPLIITIHDMTYERFPEYFWAQDPLTLQKRLNAERADKIIAISETTRRDLIKYLDVAPEKVEVVYHGIDLHAAFRTKIIEALPPEYLLYVGDRSGYKNFYLFINAYKELSGKHPALKLILTGGGKLEIAEKECLLRLNLADKVRHINATDEELNYLYQNARAFVYPSLHEGFGLPILEAFRAKCPILLSETDCFLEIAGDAAVYFNPYSQDDLMLKLEKIIGSEDERKRLIEAGSLRLLDFSLDKSMKETFAVYRNLI